MPHILITACNTTCNMQELAIDARIHFNQDYYKSPKAEVLLEELHKDLQAVVEKYFPNYYESEAYMSNHQFNYEGGNRVLNMIPENK